MENVFISDCKTKFICTSNGSPCFIRGTHQQIIRNLGLDIKTMKNLSVHFHFEGKGTSIKNFLKNFM